jgi:hypothetical protein
MPAELQVQLTLDVDRIDMAALMSVTRRWFEAGGPLFGGPLWSRLMARSTPPGDVSSRWASGPGDVWAECAVSFGWDQPWGGYTPQRWNELLAAAHGPSLALAFTVYELAVVAGLSTPGFPRLSLSARYVDAANPTWWALKAQASCDLLTAGGPGDEDRFLSFIREIAEAGNPTYGEVGYSNVSHVDYATAYEHKMGLPPWQTVHKSRRRLRGYSWLTIIGARLGDDLGGMDALRAAGAFAEVDRLPGGSYWLLATPRFADYGIDQAVAVQQVLAPALWPGVPTPDVEGEAPSLLALADASPPGRRRAHRSTVDVWDHRVDPRDTSTHQCAVTQRIASLHQRFPDALIWGTTTNEDGPHLVCWGAEPGEVWVWRVIPSDDPYFGLDIARDIRPDLAEVGRDPLSTGMRVRPGPPFAEIGLDRLEAIADSMVGPAETVVVDDAGPGLQLCHHESRRADEVLRRRLADASITVQKLKQGVIAQRKRAAGRRAVRVAG